MPTTAVQRKDDGEAPLARLARIVESRIQPVQRVQAPGAQNATAVHAAAAEGISEQLVASESHHGASTESGQLENPATAGTTLSYQLQTTLPGKGQGTPETELRSSGHASTAGAEVTANSAVAPAGVPVVGAGANDCVPSTASAVAVWNVVEAGANWRPDVTALHLAGRIRINPWPSNPTSMTVPNTPNAVGGGNINNTAGSPNHWQAAIR